MSRIGKKLITIPKGIKFSLKGNTIHAEGPHGKLDLAINEGIKVEISGDHIAVTRSADIKTARSNHGTVRALIANMAAGVLNGYKKELDIVGVGYKCQMKGKNLQLTLGFSHPVEIPTPEGIKMTAPSQTHIIIEGADKQVVGELSAKIRKILPPEPYKGKGIRFTGEEVKKKLGKALAK